MWVKNVVNARIVQLESLFTCHDLDPCISLETRWLSTSHERFLRTITPLPLCAASYTLECRQQSRRGSSPQPPPLAHILSRQIILLGTSADTRVLTVGKILFLALNGWPGRRVARAG